MFTAIGQFLQVVNVDMGSSWREFLSSASSAPGVGGISYSENVYR